MKIKDIRNPGKPSYGKELDVYGVYWNDGIRVYFVIPTKDYNGFLAINEKDSELTDSLLNGFVLRKDDMGTDMFLHWAADKDNLIYDLIEHDPEAMKEFKRRLAEGYQN